MDFKANSGIDNIWLCAIIFLTISIAWLFIRKFRVMEIKLCIALVSFSVFFYSGFGIALEEVNNNYIIYFCIYLFFLLLPLLLVKKTRAIGAYSKFDEYILSKQRTIEKLGITYLLFWLFPCIYPRFLLGNIFNFFSAGNILNIFDTYDALKSDWLVALFDNISSILQPAFYIYIGLLVINNKKVKASLFVIVQMLLQFSKTSYLGRYQMMMYALFIIFILIPPIKDNKINKKTFIVTGAFVLAVLPLLYAFTFIRLGNEVGALSFSKTSESLVLSESYYPIFYDQILNRDIQTSLFTMALWVICLPIPSLIWHSKPVIDTLQFTYFLTGLKRGDSGFTILLPSVLGESFSIGGPTFFFVHALIVGLVYVPFVKLFSSHKTLRYLFFYFMISSLVLGRGGAGSFLPNLINGNISLFIFYYYWKSKYKQVI